MRAAGKADFFVDVPNVGRFSFARRTMRDTFLIRGEYNRLTNGNYTPEGLAADIGAWAVATLLVLTVSCPDSFNIETVDPLTDDTWEDKVADIFTALRAQELSFRPKRPPESQAGGEGAGGQLPDGVSPPV